MCIQLQMILYVTNRKKTAKNRILHNLEMALEMHF